LPVAEAGRRASISSRRRSAKRRLEVTPLAIESI
jgi:hypothetical protein